MEKIKLEGIKNIRDFGGTLVKEGRIKKFKILRGPCLDDLTKNDVNLLVNKYRLRTIIDLRTDVEVQDRPDIDIFDVKYLHLPIFNKRVPGITHEKIDGDEEECNFIFTQMYKEMLTNEYLENISEIIKTIIALNREDFSVLIHCTEGKDRTGVISAILLLILGADKETVIDDYLYTNKVNKRKAYKSWFKTFFMDADLKSAEEVKDFYLAKPEYIQAFFGMIEHNWNSIGDFIENGLQLSNAEVEEFKDKILY